MKQKYQIIGFFYEVNGLKYRKYLDIKLKSSVLKKPDLMIVMMNPGSSYPLDNIDNNIIPTLAVPDNTQNQIMKVMTNCSFKYARVLNLSDIRMSKSKEFIKFIDTPEAKIYSHSIFSANRANDFLNLFAVNVPIIFGWGVNRELKNLAELAITTINCSQPIGIKKIGFDYAYYHPLPPVNNKQKEWVEKISKALLATNKIAS